MFSFAPIDFGQWLAAISLIMLSASEVFKSRREISIDLSEFRRIAFVMGILFVGFAIYALLTA